MKFRIQKEKILDALKLEIAELSKPMEPLPMPDSSKVDREHEEKLKAWRKKVKTNINCTAETNIKFGKKLKGKSFQNEFLKQLEAGGSRFHNMTTPSYPTIPYMPVKPVTSNPSPKHTPEQIAYKVEVLTNLLRAHELNQQKIISLGQHDTELTLILKHFPNLESLPSKKKIEKNETQN